MGFIDTWIVVLTVLWASGATSSAQSYQDKTSILDYPFFGTVEAHIGDEIIKCQGVIVDDYYVMSSQSCLTNNSIPSSTWVRVSTDILGHGGSVIRCNSFNHINNTDFTMIGVERRFEYDSKTSWVNPNVDGTKEGQDATVVAWMNKNSPGSRLAATLVTVMPAANCSQMYAGILDITASMFCIEPKSPSDSLYHVDVGSPMYYNEQYYGMVVYKPDSGSSLPVVIMQIADYTSWIIFILCDIFAYF